MTTVRKDISPKLRFEVLKRDNFACVYCGQRAGSEVNLVIDHIIPVAKGGPTALDNLQSACSDCNAGKSAGHVLKDGPAKAAMYKGKYFHTFGEDGNVEYQGWVRDEDNDVVEVCHFDWFTGSLSAGSRMIPKTETRSWRWYAEGEQMREAYDRGLVPRGATYDDVTFVDGDKVWASLPKEVRESLEAIDD